MVGGAQRGGEDGRRRGGPRPGEAAGRLAKRYLEEEEKRERKKTEENVTRRQKTERDASRECTDKEAVLRLDTTPPPVLQTLKNPTRFTHLTQITPCLRLCDPSCDSSQEGRTNGRSQVALQMGFRLYLCGARIDGTARRQCNILPASPSSMPSSWLAGASRQRRLTICLRLYAMDYASFSFSFSICLVICI